MKFKPRSFQIFWDVHAWAGVVSALLLYVTFFAAPFALFYRELNQWADPSGSQSSAGPSAALQPLFEQLVREAHVIGKDRVAFMPREAGLEAYWSQGDREAQFRLSAETGRLEPLRSELGSFLYQLHYLGPIPNGIYVAGVAAVALLLTLVTGVLMHLKDLVRQWFQFRPERVTRTWSSDLHKVLGVFGLPYQLFYAWSGAVICLSGATVEPTFRAALFGGDARAELAARGQHATIEPTGQRSSALPNLDALVVRARGALPGLTPNWIGIEHVGDENSLIRVDGQLPGIAFGSAQVWLRASDGRVVWTLNPRNATALQRFEAWFFGLHYARFGGYGIRLLYALLAWATCAVIVSGNLIWLERRDPRRAQLGNRILERLTVGWCAGLVLATAGLFFVNRLLPAGLPQRATLEKLVFGLVWLLAALCPWLWRARRNVAGWQLIAAGALFGLVPVFELLAHPAAISSRIDRGVALVLVLFALSVGRVGACLLRAAPTPAERLSDEIEQIGEAQ